MKLVLPSVLKSMGILGMNARNISYVSKYNDRRLYPLVDNKLKTKKLAEEHGLRTPDLFGYVQYQAQIKKIKELLPIDEGFVLKPAQGSGGKGILIIVRQENDAFYKANGDKIEFHELKRHISNILSGLYSLGGKDDVALIERVIEFDDRFKGFSFEGVPDVRVLVYRGYPVMAMMRLSTSISDGKANLHQGAIGVGLDIVTGKAVSAILFDKPITEHPDTNQDLSLLEIPRWQEILELAAGSYDMTNLGYLGADIVLGKNKGPMLLELNARPGLAIQIANDRGLTKRLKQVDEVADEHLSVDDRIQFSLTHFGVKND